LPAGQKSAQRIRSGLSTGLFPVSGLQAGLRSTSSSHSKSYGAALLVYYVFGLLFLEGKDLSKQPSALARLPHFDIFSSRFF